MVNRPPRPTEFPIEEGKRRIKLIISYDGAPFYGWQIQHNGPSVQQCIEVALKNNKRGCKGSWFWKN